MFARLKSIDERIFDNIPRIYRPAISKIMVAASKLGNAGIIWWYVCAIFLIIPKWRYTGLVIIFSIGLTSLMGEGIIKHTVKRTRPCKQLDDDVKLINDPRAYYSFPSGHTSSSFAVALVIFFHRDMFGERRWMGIVPVVIAALIAFSRLWNVVHYPTDVVAGIAVGVLSAYVAEWISKRYLVKYFPDSPPSAS